MLEVSHPAVCRPRADKSLETWPSFAFGQNGRIFTISFVIGLGCYAQASSGQVNVSSTMETAGLTVSASTILIKRLSDRQTWISNPMRASQRFSPASTSKIPHTLIALENSLALPETKFAWDGNNKGFDVWNKDHTLKSAFAHSVVWVFQDIVQIAGQDTMAAGLEGFNYGNANVGTLEHLTKYWLDGTLQISAFEQVEFLSKLARKTLPLSGETFDDAREIMLRDHAENWSLFAKTGWRHSKEEVDVGWYVGWLECPDDQYVFAMNMDINSRDDLPLRESAVITALESIDAFDCA